MTVLLELYPSLTWVTVTIFSFSFCTIAIIIFLNLKFHIIHSDSVLAFNFLCIKLNFFQNIYLAYASWGFHRSADSLQCVATGDQIVGTRKSSGSDTTAMLFVLSILMALCLGNPVLEARIKLSTDHLLSSPKWIILPIYPF